MTILLFSLLDGMTMSGTDDGLASLERLQTAVDFFGRTKVVPVTASQSATRVQSCSQVTDADFLCLHSDREATPELGTQDYI